ncbi:MAG: D-alanine--D-alanine ligase family protein [Spirochaetota bacterium]
MNIPTIAFNSALFKSPRFVQKNLGKLRVGLTFDLQEEYLARNYSPEETAELDSPETIEALERALRALGYQPMRIGGIEALVGKLAAGERWDLVFNIAEGMHGLGREAQIPALLDAYRIPYTFSDPLVLAITLHKGIAKHILKNMGVATPDFIVVNTLSDLEGHSLAFPLFLKPAAEGTGKGISRRSLVYNDTDLRERCALLLAKFRQPVLLETFLPGREFTVGILGTGAGARALQPMEVAFRSETTGVIYSYETKKNYNELVEYSLLTGELGKACQELALAAWRGLGCRDGGRVDLRLDSQGRPGFIEVNPLAGLHPVDSDLPILCRLVGISYETLIGEIMSSALERLHKRKVVQYAP